MDERGTTRKRRLTTATVVILILLLLWVMAACVLSAAAADRTTVLLSLRSKLTADYSGDAGMRPLSPFRLSIITDAMRDRGMDESAEDHEQALKDMMDAPVPTATARDFEGEAPFTPTAKPPSITPSSTPGDRLSSSPTPSLMPQPTSITQIDETPASAATSAPSSTTAPSISPTPALTFTPTGTWASAPPPTSTPEPSDTPAPPTPTFTPTETSPPSPEDESDPVIEDWRVEPDPGQVGSCSVRVWFTRVRVRDPRHSEGIDWARLKYNVNGRGCFRYSSRLNRTSTSLNCIAGSCEVVATFRGHIHVDLNSYYASGNCGPWPDEEDDFVVRIWIQARDKVGHQSEKLVGAYRLSDECGEDD